MRLFRQKGETFSDTIFNVVNMIIMTVLLVIWLYPLLYILSASFSEPTMVDSGEMWLIPVGFTLEGYERLLGYSEIWRGYLNTIMYTVFGTLVNLAVTLPCAYALSRKDFAGRKIINIYLVVTMFFSGGLIPTYLVVADFNLLNTPLIMIIMGATAAYNIFIARTFFSTTIPDELQEAARIDGGTNATLFFRIVLPLSAPIIAVMALFFGVGHWNSYFNAMIYLKDREFYPLQLILREILIQSQVSAEMTMDVDVAASLAAQARISGLIKYGSIVISTVPMLITYVALQKHFVKGVMIGAVKG